MTRSIAILALAFTFAACERSDSFGGSGSAGSAGVGSATPVEKQPPPVAPPPADPGFGDVAFKTFRSGSYSIQFTTKSKVETWWANMAGETVHGTYEQIGAEIVVHWDPKATNNGSSQERFHQMGPCSMARYDRTDRRSGKLVENTLIYQQKQPRCDTIRVVK